MNPIQLPLHPDLAPIALPAKHYAWFQLANAHPSNYWKKAWWFSFKEKFLARYAMRDGYDLQIIEHTCYACDGAGGCPRCTDGIYHRAEVSLQRWVFPNGDVYHKPASYLPAGRPEIYKSQIQGLIRHRDISESVAIRAALRLFFRYDRALFWKLLDTYYGMGAIRSVIDRKTYRLRWRIHRLYSRLCESFQKPDEIPF